MQDYLKITAISIFSQWNRSSSTSYSFTWLNWKNIHEENRETLTCRGTSKMDYCSLLDFCKELAYSDDSWQIYQKQNSQCVAIRNREPLVIVPKPISVTLNEVQSKKYFFSDVGDVWKELSVALKGEIDKWNKPFLQPVFLAVLSIFDIKDIP